MGARAAVKSKAALGVAYGAVLRVSEVVSLKVLGRMVLRIEQGKGGKDRHAMLSPPLSELLRDWWRIARPQVWLFPGLDPINPTSNADPVSADSNGQRRATSENFIEAVIRRRAPHS